MAMENWENEGGSFKSSPSAEAREARRRERAAQEELVRLAREEAIMTNAEAEDLIELWAYGMESRGHWVAANWARSQVQELAIELQREGVLDYVA